MCNPAIAVTAISTAVQMVGQYAQARGQRQANEYNAKVAANEAATQRQLADNEMAKGAAERNRLLRAGAQHMGEMRSQLGASGFTMDSGSTLSLLEQSAAEIQYDANITSQNAAMNAWQNEYGAVRSTNDSIWARHQSKDKSYLFSMGGSLLSGIAGGMDKFGAKAPSAKTSFGG